MKFMKKRYIISIIPSTYKDREGTVKTDLKTNAHILYMTVRGVKFEGQDFELMELWTHERVASGFITNVQETFLCDKHEFVQENDWVYKDWDFGNIHTHNR